MSRPIQLSVKPRLKVWFELDGEYAFGFGLCEILRVIRETGSIKAAASQIRKSYRHVWGRLKEAEAILGRPLVQSRVGGRLDHRSELTEEAERMLDGFLSLRATMQSVLEAEFQKCFGEHQPDSE